MGSKMEDLQSRMSQPGLQRMRSIGSQFSPIAAIFPDRRRISNRQHLAMSVDLSFGDAGRADADAVLRHLVFDQ